MGVWSTKYGDRSLEKVQCRNDRHDVSTIRCMYDIYDFLQVLVKIN